MPALGDPVAREHRSLHEIQDESEGGRRRKRARHKQRRQGRHRNSANGKSRGDCHIDNGRRRKPEARARTPQAPAFANRVDRRLATKHQDDEGQSSSAPRFRDHAKSAHGQDAGAEGQ